ncbi:MAG: short-chain dehydrogenase/reductase SDR [Erysipelotrichaceae bacterium]|nr:MAG: short-chain dehydrogenase/reductase [Erysipelotrichaceae bacterium]TXT18071.1 MAG: short-chain dehydrogenase/reductase SDR [Erysipelotrichaceae bacterium]
MRKFTLITGASSGLGLDYATEYAKANENLILIARRIDRLETIKADLLAKYPIEVLIYRVDLSDQKQTDQFLDQIPKDIFVVRLINNAGFGHHDAFEDYPNEVVSGMIEVNVLALTRLAHYFIPKMKAAQEGEILNVASMAAFTPGPFMAEYYATKAYVVSFSMALHEELKPFKIKVSALCPGPTHTEFGQAAKYKHHDGIQSKVSMASLPVVKMSIKALKQNKKIAVPGFTNKILKVLMSIIPLSISSKVISRIQKQRF